MYIIQPKLACNIAHKKHNHSIKKISLKTDLILTEFKGGSLWTVDIDIWH